MEVIPLENTEGKHVILFDGVCNLCNGWVTFVLKRDVKGQFSFASLQSKAGQNIIRHFSLFPDDLDSIILIEGSSYHRKSTAVLRIARTLSGIWAVMYMFIIVPRSWRDKVYDVVAKNRYRWFGKVERCMVPEGHIRDRFLDWNGTEGIEA